MRQFVYTLFITTNPASFHLWWKWSLVKHQKFSKYYENDCSFILKNYFALLDLAPQTEFAELRALRAFVSSRLTCLCTLRAFVPYMPYLPYSRAQHIFFTQLMCLICARDFYFPKFIKNTTNTTKQAWNFLSGKSF